MAGWRRHLELAMQAMLLRAGHQHIIEEDGVQPVQGLFTFDACSQLNQL